jgi:hypothetical protein
MSLTVALKDLLTEATHRCQACATTVKVFRNVVIDCNRQTQCETPSRNREHGAQIVRCAKLL